MIIYTLIYDVYIYYVILLSESNGVATEIMPGTPPALADLCEIIETTRPTVRFEAWKALGQRYPAWKHDEAYYPLV